MSDNAPAHASSNRPRVLYLSHAPEDIYDVVRRMAGEDIDLVLLPDNDEAARCAALADCDAVVVASYRLTAEHLAAAKKLQLVHHQGVGWHDTTDWKTIRDRDIKLAITLSGSTISVAEHTLMLMLAACRHLAYADAELRKGKWLVNALRTRSREIMGRTIGIVGMGRIGLQVAERLVPFGIKGLYCDPNVELDSATEQRLNMQKTDFDTLISRSDIVTLHLPLMASTHNIISAEVIDAMKAGSILINAARGGLVDEGALDAALRRGHLQSAGLDVFEGEPPSADNLLLSNPACILTPHIAAGTRDALEQKLAAVFANISSFFRGESLENEVDLHSHQD
ncbi:MAG: 2-hydroxyacid dehydrogenase [Candidatus Puniceispirillaceae bacterium]